jgi:hypothetical protein
MHLRSDRHHFGRLRIVVPADKQCDVILLVREARQQFVIVAFVTTVPF